MQSNTVGYDEGSKVELKKELFLGDAISDLPPVCLFEVPCYYFCLFCAAFNDLNIYLQVENNEERNEMPYGSEPETEFQHFIRLRRDGELMVS